MILEITHNYKTEASTMQSKWALLSLFIVMWSTAQTQTSGKPSVEVNQALGTIVVRAYPDAIKKVDQLVERVRKIYDRQVVIDAKLLEVQLDKSNQFGLDLNLPKFSVTSSSSGIGFFKNSATYSANAAGSDQPYMVFLNYLQKQGTVTVLSSPRIVTMNKQKAIMKIGDEKYYALDASSSTSTSTDTVLGSTISAKPFFSGIALDVTPEIVNDNEVILHIHPIVSEITEDSIETTVSGTASSLTVPKTSVRESDQIIKAKNGEFIAIGGLIKRKTTSLQEKLPGGHYDKSNSDDSESTELVIVLIPRIVDLNKRDSLLPNSDFGALTSIDPAKKYLTEETFGDSKPSERDGMSQERQDAKKKALKAKLKEALK